MSPAEAAVELAGWTVPWWVAGGWAIDLLVGRRTRSHDDLDIAILRRDHVVVREHLEGWDVWVADPPGVLRPWSLGEALPIHAHDVWCRRHPDAAWSLQLMIEEADGDEWRYRRDGRIRRPIGSLAGRASTADRAVLSPEVQLLYKSPEPRTKDLADFEVACDLLTSDERAWLRASLQTVAPNHPWLPQL